MEERAHRPDAIDEGTARFWNGRSLDDIAAGVRPIKSWDDLAIAGLTAKEWESFQAALKED